MRKQKKNWIGLLFILPSLTGIFVFYLFPFLGSLSYTFTQGVAEQKFSGFQNFTDLMKNVVFRKAALNTFLFLSVGIVLLITISLTVSVIAVKRPFRWQRWALMLPVAIPSASLALGWQSLWGMEGAIGKLLGMPEVDFLSGPLAFPLAVLLFAVKNVGYISILLMSAIDTLPAEHRESFRLEDNREIKYIQHILLPEIFPILLVAILLAVMQYFLFFRDLYTLYGDNPPQSVYMLQHFMNASFYQLNFQRLSASALLMILFLAAFAAVLLYLQRRMEQDVG
ncbi:sugar ABC transporter permease [Catenibacillus scindens]|uniref:carbohydrate ABC transporter permease n=1 Tax=Catenibacillus scindens TaxID=673271 RepID=UPI00320AAAEB